MSKALRLIVAEKVLTGEIKYFLSDAGEDVPVETLLRVAFSRWRIEKCFEDYKGELGMDHFEVRKWRTGGSSGSPGRTNPMADCFRSAHCDAPYCWARREGIHLA